MPSDRAEPTDPAASSAPPRRARTSPRARRSLLLTGTAIGFVLGLAFAVATVTTPPSQAEPEDPERAIDPASAAPFMPLAAESALSPDLLESERNTIEIFRAAAPSVVYVTNNALRRDFFSMNVTEVEQGTGSGFLWDEHGHVVTNYHVLEFGQTFSVALPSGEKREARVVGVEPRKDLAVLHFDTSGLSLEPLPVGRSESLIVGQKVLAIGNPFGLDRTLTTGIISALGREFPLDDGFVIEDVIQTDASINPGNSGGPLIDSSGKVIGVNTAIYSPSGGSAGIGFAIPIDTVARIVPQLIRFGEVRRAGLGVLMMSDYWARRYGIRGVVVREVRPGSPADLAGLRSIRTDRRGNIFADVVTGVDGQEITGFADLANALDGREVGETVVLTVMRGREAVPIQMELQEIRSERR